MDFHEQHVLGLSWLCFSKQNNDYFLTHSVKLNKYIGIEVSVSSFLEKTDKFILVHRDTISEAK